MSKLSKIRASRRNWKEKSITRGANHRYACKEQGRYKNERNRYKKQYHQTLILLEAERKKKHPSSVNQMLSI